MDPDDDLEPEPASAWVLAAVNLVPVIGPPLATTFALFQSDRDHRALVALEDIFTATQLTIDEFRQRLEDHEQLWNTFEQAVGASRRTADETHVRALIQAAANGFLASDDAEIDVAQMQVDALAQMNTVHVRSLLMFVNDDGNPVPRRAPDMAGPKESPLLGDAAFAALAKLEQVGAVAVATMQSESSYNIAEERRPAKYGDGGKGRVKWFGGRPYYEVPEFHLTPFGAGLLDLLGVKGTWQKRD